MRHRSRRLVAIAAAVLGAALIAAPAWAKKPEGERLGIGFILGEPSGLSAKYWLSPPGAVDFGLAYSFASFLEIYVDYLHHFPRAFGASSEFVSQLTPYVGIGGLFLVGGSSRPLSAAYYSASGPGFGFRLPLGIEWRAHRPPIGIYVELTPGLGLIPATFGFLEGGVGGRFYF